MPKNHRTPGTHIIDKLIFIGVPDVRSLPPHNKWWIPAHRSERPYRRVHSARNQPFRAFLQTPRLLDLSGCYGRHRTLPELRKISTPTRTDYYTSAISPR